MKHIKLWAFIGILALGILGIKALPVLAGCADGTTGDDVINCDTSLPAGQDVDGDLGNDSITVEAGVTVTDVGGDTAGNGALTNGLAGDDVITNNGTVTGNIVGDYTNTGDGGDDIITNNGTVDGNIYGDVQGLVGNVGGNDTIVNNGHIKGGVYGDNFPLAGGSDTIINNGVIDGAVIGNGVGHGVENAGDTIVNNGTVGGEILGEGGNDNITNSGVAQSNIDAELGDDTVTLVVGSTVGGTVMGGDGTDTLIFSGSTTDEAGFNQIQSLVGCNPCAGTVTLDGKTYTFDSFEALKNLLILLAKAGAANIDINFASRVNRADKGAPFAVYCTSDVIKVVDIAPNSQGSAEFNFALGKLPSAGAKPIVLASGEGNQLILQSDGTLLAVGPSLDGMKTYSVQFTAACGSLGIGTER